MKSVEELTQFIPDGFEKVDESTETDRISVKAVRVCPAAPGALKTLNRGYSEVQLWFVAESNTEEDLCYRGAVSRQEDSEDELDYEWVAFAWSKFSSFAAWEMWAKSFAEF